MTATATDELVFLHFNDVYHIDRPEIVAQFLTQLRAWRKEYASKQPYTVFSGDVFSPSLEASILTGEHMVPVLKNLEIDLGCFGNHDFDFGEERLRALAGQTDFPWLLSNALRLKKGEIQSVCDEHGKLRQDRLLADAKMYRVATLQGYKVGFFGLAGTDWPSNCRELPECYIASPVETARAVSRHLRTVEKCDFVIAVTHMRLIEDIEVSQALREPGDESRIDLLLGGHDHDLLRRYDGETACDNPEIIDANMSNSEAVLDDTGMVRDASGAIRIVKSGTDWKSLSLVRLHVSRSALGIATLHNISLHQVANMRKLPHDSTALSSSFDQIQNSLKSVNEHISALGSQPLLLSTVPLEGTGSIVRSRETNLCNLLADMVRAYYDIDIAFVNSGSVRCDRLIPSTTSTNHPLTVRDMIDILPFNNALMVKRVSSSALLSALENSISDAHTDGRFMQFSGLSLVADWSAPEGSRVISASFHPLASKSTVLITKDLDRTFSIAMVAFIAEGFDGYTCFKSCETLVGEEGAMTDTELLLRMLGYVPNDGSATDRGNEEEEVHRIERARKAVISDWDKETGLPVVKPVVEGRIRFVEKEESWKIASGETGNRP